MLAWFSQGKLVRPSADEPNFVDLVRALAHQVGVTKLPIGSHADALAGKIGRADHVVFVLIDGLGWEQLHALLPPGSFLREHVVDRLQAVFVSTTACALTSLATAQWPSVHAVLGWWTYLPATDIGAVTLPFVNRLTGEPLDQCGVAPRDLYPASSVWSRIRRQPMSFLPAPIAGSVYSRYCCGDTPMQGYEVWTDAIAAVAEQVRAAVDPTFTYLYLPQYDSVVHTLGTEHPDVYELIGQIDARLEELRERLPRSARMIVSADHGMVDTPDGRRVILPENDPLIGHLLAVPSGERTTPIFHVRPGHEQAFAGMMAERFSEHFALLSADEVLELRLLGPDDPVPETTERLGTFMGIAPHAVQLLVDVGKEARARLVGVHGGLSPDEMHVPVIVA